MKKYIALLVILTMSMPAIAANSKTHSTLKKLINIDTSSFKIVCQPYPECTDYETKVNIKYNLPKGTFKTKHQGKRSNKFTIKKVFK